MGAGIGMGCLGSEGGSRVTFRMLGGEGYVGFMLSEMEVMREFSFSSS